MTPNTTSRRVRVVADGLARYYHETGSRYVKARELGERIGLSAKQVAAALRRLDDEGAVEQWGRTRAVSWYITDELADGRPEVLCS